MTSQQSDKTNKPETSTYEKIQNAQPTSAHDIPSPKSADIKIDSSTDADAKQSTDEIALLKDKLKNAEKTFEEEKKDAKLRHLAELKNLNDRHQREVTKARDYAVQNFAKDLLSIADALHQGIESAEGDQKKGLEMMLDIFNKTLEKNHISPLNPVNQVYDPHQHEAMVMQPAPEVEHNHIVQVVQVGYLLKDRLLRPARVIVANNR